ncbi:MAG: septal ring lytic transglycosylase RlpA family protein [Desulfuromonadales bacterium]|nr:septal ring lytic transglycosylase RlpA family protein [Desulfuromonadales bacterium]
MFLRCRGVICCLVALLLTACVGRQRVKEPAGYPTKRGQQPYTVNGTRYEPLASHIGFEQEGIASSYGSDFHGRTTSSGELFDMTAMTAAHKTLPLGVFVRVRDKRTGRDVVVRINDRGPFVQERIIDLSAAAAARLGILRDGLAPVKITALGYRSEDFRGSPTYRSPESYDRGSFALQVGAFVQKANAERFAVELRRNYGTADVQEALVSGAKYYRVRLGKYSSLKAAQTSQDRYQRGRFPGCFVVALD